MRRSDEVELQLVVHGRRELADGVVGLEFRDVNGAQLPSWSAGAHVDVTVAPSTVRQYSLCGDVEDRTTWTVAVLREVVGRGGSRAVHDTVREGDVLDARGPRNYFPLEPSDRYVFVAGGIGITPIVPMLAQAEAQGADWRLVYGGRTWASMAFAGDLLEKYGHRVLVLPQDEHGLLDLETALVDVDDGTLVYSCGPAPLLQAVEQGCARWPSRLHLERFQAPQTASQVTSEPISVRLAQTGIEFMVPAGRSILEAVENAGVDALYSCREGVCGTCETRVLDGVPDHHDFVLSEAERAAGDVMLICVSRAVTEHLVLDL